MKKLLAIILIAIGHAVLTFVLFLHSFMLGSSQLDTGVPATVGEQFLGVVVEILMWPLLAPLVDWGGKYVIRIFPGFLGYIPCFINSLLWGIIIVWIWCKLKKNKRFKTFTTSASIKQQNKF